MKFAEMTAPDTAVVRFHKEWDAERAISILLQKYSIMGIKCLTLHLRKSLWLSMFTVSCLLKLVVKKIIDDSCSFSCTLCYE